MKTKGHKLIGRYLMKNLQHLPAQRYEKAFLFGCIEPDFNPFTYLKGSWRARLLRGHNYNNAAPCMLHSIRRLQQKQKWKLREYYQLGKLIHYVTDAFTFAHNDAFGRSIRGHRRYEFRLHGYFERFMEALELVPPPDDTAQSAADYLLAKHRQYRRASNGPQTDAQFVLKATSTVFRGLLPDPVLFAGFPLGEAAG